jgi:ABC-type branched-subunit amino acid transport system ATPase component
MLTSLKIANFRALKDFHVRQLGRVNLIVGRNNSGKSTVLEAVRIYAGNAHRGLLDQIAVSHDEIYRVGDTDLAQLDQGLPFEDLFSGRRFPATDGQPIVIGDPNSDQLMLTLEHVYLQEYQEIPSEEPGLTEPITRRRLIAKSSIPNFSGPDAIIRQAIMVRKGKENPSYILLDTPRYRRPTPMETTGAMPCSFIPTQFVSMNDLARAWDKVALTEHERVVNEALQYIAPDFEGLAFVESDEPHYVGPGRREFPRVAKVRMSDSPRPISLNSLGDGMLRVLQLVLHVFQARGGFLLIDEFENGLHYSIQENIWALIFNLAERLDIQVFATTHGWDCVESFSKVAKSQTEISAVLFRVGKSVKQSNAGQIIATSFDKEQLYNITQMDAEVR